MAFDVTKAVSGGKFDSAPDQTAMDGLKEIAERVYTYKSDIAALEKSLASAKKELQNSLVNEIPDYMDAHGIRKMELEDGTEVSVIDDFYCRMVPDMEDKAIDYLVGEDAADLVKVETVVKYSKGALEEALELAKELQERGLAVKAEQSIHWKTLQSWYSNHIKDGGAELPQDLFESKAFRLAKLKQK
jgi:hypothetical protein